VSELGSSTSASGGEIHRVGPKIAPPTATAENRTARGTGADRVYLKHEDGASLLAHDDNTDDTDSVTIFPRIPSRPLPSHEAP
jgi:hypothetical protein